MLTAKSVQHNPVVGTIPKWAVAIRLGGTSSFYSEINFHLLPLLGLAGGIGWLVFTL